MPPVLPGAAKPEAGNGVAAATPAEAKGLGAQVRGFDSTVWEAERFPVVVVGNRAKFGQHPDLAAFLRGTAPQVLLSTSRPLLRDAQQHQHDHQGRSEPDTPA